MLPLILVGIFKFINNMKEKNFFESVVKQLDENGISVSNVGNNYEALNRFLVKQFDSFKSIFPNESDESITRHVVNRIITQIELGLIPAIPENEGEL